ncbi:hypothetical protein LCGC14_2617610 [marine sediment metagenome]|uniref:Uncharacterized protein n=1 Tax=marine sediment metagenome TaxID=412755 RepID=A0A0F9A3Z8_9ZZZZ
MEFYGFVPKTLKTFALRHADIIEEVSEEGVDGYWIELNPGWIDEESGLHQIHEYTIAAVKNRFQFVRKEQ